MRKELLVWTVLGALGCGAPPMNAASEDGTAEVGLAWRSEAMAGATAVNVTILGVELHVAGARDVLVPMGPVSVNLLELRHDARMLLGTTPFDGKVEMIRIVMDGTVSGTFADGTPFVARVPSGAESGLKIIAHGLRFGASKVTLNFVPERALHRTGRGEWVMRPTIKLGDVEGTRGGRDPRSDDADGDDGDDGVGDVDDGEDGEDGEDGDDDGDHPGRRCGGSAGGSSPRGHGGGPGTSSGAPDAGDDIHVGEPVGYDAGLPSVDTGIPK